MGSFKGLFCVKSKPLAWLYPLQNIQSNLDYSKCQGPQESFRIIGSSNDQNRKFSEKLRCFHRMSLFRQSLQLQLVFSVE